MSGDPVRWRDWVAREETAEDTIDLVRVRAMQALLDRDEGLRAGDALPPLWHWLYFWETVPQSRLGPEGHAALGDFLPPVDLPRRMWAGSRLAFLRDLPIGAVATRRSRVIEVAEKEGRSGPLVFVTLRHEVAAGGALCIEEEHDIVYRAAADGGAQAQGTAAPEEATWRRQLLPDPVLLFRYSALTFNGHRIHYDRPYTTEVEGYPGLIVHGPLMATLMVELVRHAHPGRRIARFQFRALAPVFDGAPMTVAGQPAAEDHIAAVWVADADGRLCMKGTVEMG